MDSSPDLSLKLRRGSSDSRDNFYMDFAQGIDSDIEEVDNSLLQQPATAPPLQDDMDYVGIPPPPPPLMGIVVTQPQVLPTLSEHDDLPSPPPSPTSSILEMMPPPPLSPTFHRKSNSKDQSSSPPIETEDEEDDDDGGEGEINGHDADIEETLEGAKADELNKIIPTEYTNGVENGTAGEGDGDESISPPSRVTTPPNQFLYSSNNDDEEQLPQPMQGSTPSISPSPPVTPPPCPELTSISKIVSPPPLNISQIPALTSHSDSDQSQPDSPTSSKSQQAQEVLMPTIPHPPPEYETTEYDEPPIRLSNLPTDYEEPGDEYIDLTKAKKEAEQEDIKSYYDEESATIPTSHGNGYLGQPIQQIVEKQLTSDVTLELEDESLHEEKNEHYLRGKEEITETRTPLSDTKPGDLDESSSEPQSIHEGEEEKSVVEEERGERRPLVPGTPTSQISQSSQTTPIPTTSGSPKRKGSITTAESVSRVSSRSASRSGSIRDSSRAGSVAGSSIVSVPTSITSGKGEIVSSPPTSIKCIRSSQDSIRSRSSIKMSRTPSQKSLSHKITSPQLSGRLQSPPEGDSAPIMPSPPLMRSPPSQMKSPALMHSPPRVTSPPKLYSPLIISSPPIRKADSPTETASPELESEPERDVIRDALPTTCSFIAASDTLVTSAAVITDDDGTVTHDDEQPKQQTMQQPVVTSAQVFSVARHQISSHHHYHLPHQFQHPHHQNHHTHSHGAVPVSTPTVPASYTSSNLTQESRHKRAASSSGDEGLSKSSSPPLTATVTPSTTTNLVICSETSSRIVVSPVKLSAARIRDSGLQHRVTIDESTLTGALGGGGSDEGNGSGPPSPGSSLEQQLTSDDRHTNHLTLMYHSSQLSNMPVLPAIKRTHRPSFMYPPMPRIRAGDALATLFSALYGKLLVVMGVAFPMAEVISTYIPPSFYEESHQPYLKVICTVFLSRRIFPFQVYYLYLYIGSMIFLLFMYATLLWGRPKIPANIASPTKSSAKTRSTSVSESMDESDAESNSIHNKRLSTTITMARRPSLLSPLGRQHHYGSFYLRMGAVAFGIGSMIYSGLEFGQYFELNPDTKCHNVLLALTPATRMAFIFIQMYFIFLNNEQIKVYRYKIVARFGLMHMIGTNLAVWLNVLIQETKHEILTFYNPENRTLRISHRIPGHSRAHSILASSESSAHLRVTRGLKGPYQIFECRRTNILGTLVQDASPFLFPCTIEYSLICAAILYVMWKGITRPQVPAPPRPDTIISPMKRSPHHYSVDCARAHKGLFVGILVLVLTIISLILFFVLISRPDFVALAVLEVTICELFIYATATIATLLGMIQIRHLQYDAFRSFSLDDILLVGAQTGSFLYNIFTVIAGHFSVRSDDWLVPINALASIVQTACQTMFILDAGRRQAVTPEHMRKKPGREIVTFMLVVNLAMWAISTLEKSRAESHPIQLNFYGLWAWTIITHVSMPLAIFYRFHSTVCLCEIWKRAYKLKPTFM